MIVRVVANAVGVVLLAAVVGALIEIGERLGQSSFGQSIADTIKQFFSKATP